MVGEFTGAVELSSALDGGATIKDGGPTMNSALSDFGNAAQVAQTFTTTFSQPLSLNEISGGGGYQSPAQMALAAQKAAAASGPSGTTGADGKSKPDKDKAPKDRDSVDSGDAGTKFGVNPADVTLGGLAKPKSDPDDKKADPSKKDEEKRKQEEQEKAAKELQDAKEEFTEISGHDPVTFEDYAKIGNRILKNKGQVKQLMDENPKFQKAAQTGFDLHGKEDADSSRRTHVEDFLAEQGKQDSDFTAQPSILGHSDATRHATPSDAGDADAGTTH